MEDSTDGNGSAISSGGGGVSACWRGEALYASTWLTAGKGGREARLTEEGDCGI